MDNKTILQAFQALALHPAAGDARARLEEMIQAQVTVLESADNSVTLHRAQGHVQALKQVLNHLNPDYLERVRVATDR